MANRLISWRNDARRLIGEQWTSHVKRPATVLIVRPNSLCLRDNAPKLSYFYSHGVHYLLSVDTTLLRLQQEPWLVHQPRLARPWSSAALPGSLPAVSESPRGRRRVFWFVQLCPSLCRQLYYDNIQRNSRDYRFTLSPPCWRANIVPRVDRVPKWASVRNQHTGHRLAPAFFPEHVSRHPQGSLVWRATGRSTEKRRLIARKRNRRRKTEFFLSFTNA